MESKYLGVVCGSLIGYGSFLDLIALYEDPNRIAKLLEKAHDVHHTILKDSKFWKLAHHNNTSVSKLTVTNPRALN
jgi:hypothetical protein